MSAPWKVFYMFVLVLIISALPNNLGLILNSRGESIEIGHVISIDDQPGSIRHATRITVEIKAFEGDTFESTLYDRLNFEVQPGDTVSYRNLYNGGGVRILTVNTEKVQSYWRSWDIFTIGLYIVILLGILYKAVFLKLGK